MIDCSLCNTRHHEKSMDYIKYESGLIPICLDCKNQYTDMEIMDKVVIATATSVKEETPAQAECVSVEEVEKIGCPLCDNNNCIDNEAIKLFTEIYTHALAHGGDRNNYPCPQIEGFLLEWGVDLRGEDLEDDEGCED